MWVISAIGMFVSALLWRLTGWPRLGRVLLQALSSENESLRSIAGILIVRAGSRAEPLLQEALHRRENLSMTLTLLADVGNKMVEKEIQAFSADRDPQVAEAARQALRVLASHR